MKGLLLIAFTILTANLNAQESPSNIDKLIAKPKLFRLQTDTAKSFLKPFSFQAKTTVPGVYALPQDGMPCVVPDARSIAAMPNAANRNSISPVNRIPNAAPEQQLLPKQRMNSK